MIRRTFIIVMFRSSTKTKDKNQHFMKGFNFEIPSNERRKEEGFLFRILSRLQARKFVLVK